MAGTLIQQFGHDYVLSSFARTWLRSRCHLLHVVSPAMGVRVDLQAWDDSMQDYRPLLDGSRLHPRLRDRTLPCASAIEDFERSLFLRTNSEVSGCQFDVHFQKIILRLCDQVERACGDLPDIIEIDSEYNPSLMVELKFESFRENSQAAVLDQYQCASDLGIPFWLIVPKHPLYEKEMSTDWLINKMPGDMRIFYFSMDQSLVIPQRDQLTFEEIRSVEFSR